MLAVANSFATITDISGTLPLQAPPPSITITAALGTRVLSEDLDVVRTNAGQGILLEMLDLGGFYYHSEGRAL